ncbi:MAG TPA: phenylalanine--tRNA ligase subunit beta, partial [Gammaproteobacteria bacterium]|nr:phenylalanine--tRNA ligase subunit beta [Gammaproteobacteria bacterium]
MKVSYNWLREFVDVSLDAQALADKLSLSGLEVAGVEPAVPVFDGIVVAEITAIKDHPEADKLRICEVDAGQGERLQIVCGAPNAHQGMKAPLAMLGGKLPDGTTIKKAKLRGVESSGMLCSVRELNLGESHDGLMALSADAPVGQPLQDYLGGNDSIIDIEITPNRGDCLSMLGVARDVSALLDHELHEPAMAAVKPTHKDAIKSELLAPVACPLFVSRVIRGIDPAAQSPLWLRERLRRAGIKPISPVVDVTQYVMLELGQPMHAYDLSKLNGGITVRFANIGEKLTLLNQESVTLADDMLVISDQQQALGLAGIMGGADSAVSDATTDILLESAWFAPEAINGRSRRLGLQTDAGYRFERGVTPGNQARAVERATALLLEIVGGKPGPVETAVDKASLPKRETIVLRAQRLAAILGIDIPAAKVERILQALDMDCKAVSGGWQVQAPAHRFDIAIEADLIEEVGRIYGYDKIPALQYATAKPMDTVPETRASLADIRAALVQRGYQEAITYSFVDEKLQMQLMGEAGLALANPITQDMTHMRLSLWPGLIGALRY